MAEPGLGRMAAEPGLGRMAAEPGLGRMAAEPGLGRMAAEPGLGRMAAERERERGRENIAPMYHMHVSEASRHSDTYGVTVAFFVFLWHFFAQPFLLVFFVQPFPLQDILFSARRSQVRGGGGGACGDNTSFLNPFSAFHSLCLSFTLPLNNF